MNTAPTTRVCSDRLLAVLPRPRTPVAARPALFLACAACLLTAAGCMVGPDYQAPGTDMPAAWDTAAAPTTRPVSAFTTDAPAVRWWQAFRDPQLDKLIDLSVESNLDLRRARARVTEARARRGTVVAGLYPDLNVGGGYTHSRSAFQGGPAGDTAVEGNNFRAGLDSVWEIDVFGGTRREVEAADADIGAALEDARDVLVVLTSEVARSYVELRSFQREADIARQNAGVQRQSLRITQERLRGGRDTALDVARAEAQVARTEAVIPLLEVSARQAAHRIAVLLGREPTQLLGELSKASPIPPLPPTVPVGMPSDLLRRRPDIRRAERNLAAATARIGSAEADLFPRFSLTGSLGTRSTEFKDMFNYSARTWSVGPAVSWPIFDAGRIRSNIAVQDARQEQALATYEQSVLTALQEVNDALVAYAREQDRRALLAQAVDANRRAAQLADQRYRAGQTDFLSLLQAQRDLFETEEALVQSDRALATDLVFLYKALGGGWEIGEREQAAGGAAAIPVR